MLRRSVAVRDRDLELLPARILDDYEPHEAAEAHRIALPLVGLAEDVERMRRRHAEVDRRQRLGVSSGMGASSS